MDFDSFHIIIVDVDHICLQEFPIQIDDSFRRDDPNVVVPVEYLEEEVEIDCKQICFEEKLFPEAIQCEGMLDIHDVLIVEECRENSSEEHPHHHRVDDRDDVLMADIQHLIALLLDEMGKEYLVEIA